MSSPAYDTPVHPLAPHFVAIRREEEGYGIRFGLTEAEDELLHGPTFETLPEALDWIEAIDRRRVTGPIRT